MKVKKILIVLLSGLLLTCLLVTQASAFGLTRTVTSSSDTTYGSRYSHNAVDWFEDGIMPSSASEIPTDYVMPDYYNTGYVSAYEDLVDFGTKYPLVPKKSAGSGGWTYTINAATAALYNYCFEGFKIEHGSISFDQGGEKVLMTVDNATNSIVLRDFYINAQADISSCVFTRRLADQTRIVLLDGEFVGSTSSQVTGFNITMKRCYLHHCQADHVKGFSGQFFVGCYFAEGGLNGGNPHPDCVQFTVDDGHGNGLSTDHVYYFGNRFDAMLTSVNTTNSCIIMQSEFGGGISDVHINYNWFNGGGVAVQIGAKDNKNVGGPEYHTDVEFCYNYFGHGEKWEENYKFTARGSTLPKIQAVEKNTSTAGTTRATDLDIGSVSYYSDGALVRSLSGLTGAEKSVVYTVANYNFTATKSVCAVVVYDANGQRTATVLKSFDIAGYVPYATYSSTSWSTFRYGDQPMNVRCTVDLSDVTIPEGGYIVTEIFSNPSGNALNDLRRDVLLSGTTLPADIQTVVPAGYQLNDADANSPSRRFIDAVAACADKQSDELRAAIVSAYALYNQADEAINGVTEAKATLAGYLAQYNSGVASDNARMQDGIAVLHAATPQLVPLYATVLAALFALIRRLISRL